MNVVTATSPERPRRSRYGSAIARVWSVAQPALALVGLSVLIAAGYPSSREALLWQGDATAGGVAPLAANFVAGPIQPIQPVKPTAGELEQRAITEMLSKRYRVAEEAVGGFVAAAYKAGKATAVDPLLILAVISVESRFNPVAESNFGAKGLMQIIPKFHREKLVGHGGEEALLNPEVNIQVGAMVLREYLRRFGGTETALQAYNGAFEEPTSHYSRLVLSERSRIAQAIAKLRRSA